MVVLLRGQQVTVFFCFFFLRNKIIMNVSGDHLKIIDSFDSMSIGPGNHVCSKCIQHLPLPALPMAYTCIVIMVIVPRKY